jgi:hypothetical protein
MPQQPSRGRLIAVSAVTAAALPAALLVTGLPGLAAPPSTTARTTVPAHAHAPDGHAAHAVHHGALTAREAHLHDRMRKLWEDHITWTRLAIVSFADGSEGFAATAARLLRNQQHIGDAIKPYYGRAAGNRLTALLHDHITLAVDLLTAAKAGDQDAVDRTSRRWYANANDIADFLAGANPDAWPRHAMRVAMRAHLDQTLAEAGHELTGHYRASVRDYERVHHHILAMADTLSDGIVAAFPARFR